MIRPLLSGLPGATIQSPRKNLCKAAVGVITHTTSPLIAIPTASRAAFVIAVPAMTLLALSTRKREAKPAKNGCPPLGLVRCSSMRSTLQLGPLKVDFCGKPDTFTPIYEANPVGTTASVNAGDYGLYVGGGAINLAFAKCLGLAKFNPYQALHSEIAEVAKAAPGCLQSAQNRLASSSLGDARAVGVADCFARAHEASITGVALVDVFIDTARPISPLNVAMLYVVGPKGEGAQYSTGRGSCIADRAVFLDAVEKMAENAFSAVCEYNELAENDAIAAKEFPKIEIVQWCLVSGGVYRHPGASKMDVAEATLNGFHKAASSASVTVAPVVRFAYDDAAFETAVDHWQAKKKLSRM